MSTTTPAVNVGTYHKYNCGSIFGKWFDLTEFDSKEDFIDACHQLHANEHDPELMFQDWKGIPLQFASECSVEWDFIQAYKRAQEEGRDAAFYTGESDYDAFDDAYRGEAQSVEDYAYEYVSEFDLLSSPLCLKSCAAISTTKCMRATCSAATSCLSTAAYSATDL